MHKYCDLYLENGVPGTEYIRRFANKARWESFDNSKLFSYRVTEFKDHKYTGKNKRIILTGKWLRKKDI